MWLTNLRENSEEDERNALSTGQSSFPITSRAQLPSTIGFHRSQSRANVLEEIETSQYQYEMGSNSHHFESPYLARPTFPYVSDNRTDSGYDSRASLPNPDSPRLAILDSSLSVRGSDTPYSGFASLSHGGLDNFVSEIAVELAAGLPRSIPTHLLPDLSSTLPQLLTVYRRQISDAVTGAFQKEDDNALPLDRQSPTDTMLLDEKISMWQRTADTDEGFEYFPGVQEYRDEMLSSPAYNWLMSTISKVLCLDTFNGDTTAQSVRYSILSVLGDSDGNNIEQRSKRYYVTFRAPRLRTGSKQELTHTIALVGCETQAYATTCGDYAQLVWPESGPQMLELLAAVGQNDHAGPHTCTLFDSTEVTITTPIEQDTMEVAVAGLIDSIAEVGEQLAWLSAALNSSCESSDQICLTFSEPLWIRLSSPPTASNTHGSVPNDGGVAGFVLAYLLPRRLLTSGHLIGTSRQGRCWTSLFGELTLVKGFPIPRRPEPGTGVEIPLPMMAALAGSQKVSIFYGKLLIKGYSTALIPTRRCDEFVYWHTVSNENGDHLEFNDHRVKKILRSYPTGLTFGDLELSRHILGWCYNAVNNTGAQNAGYSIRWSGLGPPKAGLALEKVTIVAGMFVTGGASVIIGKKAKAVHLRSRDDYTMRLSVTSKIPSKSLSLYDPSEFKEPFGADQGRDAAIAALTNPENLKIPLYAKPESSEEEITTNEMGIQTRILHRTKSSYCLKDRIESICDVLEQIMAYQADVADQDGVGFRLRSTPRRHLEGFDFMDIATDEDPIRPRMIDLRSSGKGWVDFTRALHAITLFGSGFGELIQPLASQGLTHQTCASCCEIPKGQDYLAVCVRDIQDILQKKGSTSTIPWRLIDNIYWHTPDKSFEHCSTTGRSCTTHDRVQVLLPATFPKLWGRNFKSPPDLKLAPMGALLFGHSTRFPLRWSDRGDPEEGHLDQDVQEMESSFQDSGIGTNSASSGLDASDGSLSRSPASPSQGAVGSTEGILSEEKQPIKRRRLEKEPAEPGRSSEAHFSNQPGRPPCHGGNGRLMGTFLGPIPPWRKRSSPQEDSR
ncbi:hypothetical protein NUW58_g208 [Xylaria curta]|uniref:Uncharacterized protein n=1 Tax=Xylaria curta TaxID=42375 RepID=A0ACC1PQ27_9PEZI|nr:hypothetical protein NUW58_g208 [Xylaria curta]